MNIAGEARFFGADMSFGEEFVRLYRAEKKDFESLGKLFRYIRTMGFGAHSHSSLFLGPLVNFAVQALSYIVR